MAIPFLQPEEDESARHHGANGHNNVSAHAGVGAGAGSSGTGSASASGSGAVVVGGAGSSSGGAVMLAGATGPLPVPNSPAAPIISSGTSTAVQTPLIGPMNSDQLVQLFYEALYRYSRGGKCALLFCCWELVDALRCVEVGGILICHCV